LQCTWRQWSHRRHLLPRRKARGSSRILDPKRLQHMSAHN